MNPKWLNLRAQHPTVAAAFVLFPRRSPSAPSPLVVVLHSSPLLLLRRSAYCLWFYSSRICSISRRRCFFSASASASPRLFLPLPLQGSVTYSVNELGLWLLNDSELVGVVASF
ncbi:hypothetical protein PIB30_087279 [Stylosanthes scabra]|uniref:Uncharacterized protein n=1 Tax=Stylosanthes scabra TaxID=79078 RepID=A0ABU6TSU9_9FABA|nr:hypothetical protein [Stylosanthes scabra]